MDNFFKAPHHSSAVVDSCYSISTIEGMCNELFKLLTLVNTQLIEQKLYNRI